MRLNTFLRFLGVAFVFLVIPTFSAAQQSVTCEANNDNRKYCGSYDPDQVRMDRQISGSPCIQGQTWGVDRQGLWVQQGCRAVFIIIRGYSGGGPGPGPGGPDRPGWWDPEPGGTWPPRGDWHGGRWERGGPLRDGRSGSARSRMAAGAATSGGGDDAGVVVMSLRRCPWRAGIRVGSDALASYAADGEAGCVADGN